MKLVTTERALIFSAIVLLIYSLISEIQVFMGLMPNDTLTTCIFVSFGVAESGFCTFIHERKKHREHVGGESIDEFGSIDVASD